jgi:hypothetical protein
LNILNGIFFVWNHSKKTRLFDLDMPLDGKWTANGRQMDGKWTANGRQMDGKWTANGRQMDGKWTGIPELFLLFFPAQPI